MEKSIDIEVSQMIKHKLNAEEYFFLRLVIAARDGDEMPLQRYFGQYGETSRVKLFRVIHNLMIKGFIGKKYIIPEEGEPFDPMNLPLDFAKIDKFISSGVPLMEELWAIYPEEMTGSNGNVYMLKNISKHFKSWEDFANYYAKMIKNNKEIHDHIIELVKWANEQDLIKFTITEFVLSRKYQYLETLFNDPSKISCRRVNNSLDWEEF